MADRRVAARFTALYRDHYARVLAFVRRRVEEPSDGEDITAEVFRLAWARVTEGSATVSPGWLFVTAQNLLRNHRRSAVRLERLLTAAREELRLRGAASSSVDVVRAVLAGLEERHRQVLVLSYWDGLSAREVAEVLGVSVPAAWTRLHRARRAFRESYQDRVGRAR